MGIDIIRHEDVAAILQQLKDDPVAKTRFINHLDWPVSGPEISSPEPHDEPRTYRTKVPLAPLATPVQREIPKGFIEVTNDHLRKLTGEYSAALHSIWARNEAMSWIQSAEEVGKYHIDPSQIGLDGLTVKGIEALAFPLIMSKRLVHSCVRIVTGEKEIKLSLNNTNTLCKGAAAYGFQGRGPAAKNYYFVRIHDWSLKDYDLYDKVTRGYRASKYFSKIDSLFT